MRWCLQSMLPFSTAPSIRNTYRAERWLGPKYHTRYDNLLLCPVPHSMSSDYKEWKNVLIHEILLNRTRQKPSRDYLSKKVRFFGPINLTNMVQIDELQPFKGLEALSTFDELIWTNLPGAGNTRLYKNDLVFKRTESLRGLAGTDLNENNNLVFADLRVSNRI